jgi:hypothetical protein
MPALTGAAGALATDVAMGYLQNNVTFIGDNVEQNSLTSVGVKSAVAVLGGMLLKRTKVFSAKTVNEMTKGALTVYAHDAMAAMVNNSGMNIPMGQYVSRNGMGQYVGRAGRRRMPRRNLGYASAGMPVGTQTASPTNAGRNVIRARYGSGR